MSDIVIGPSFKWTLKNLLRKSKKLKVKNKNKNKNL